MGLLNKLKNVLFEEEEIDVPEEPVISKPEEPVISKQEIRKPIKLEEEKETPLVSDKDLFKAEKTFDFPIFDEEEFELMKDPVPEEPKKTMGVNLFDYERPKKPQVEKSYTPEIKGRIYDSKSREKPQAKFQPSPVISPVYGVLDKNYKKEDIIVVKNEQTKKIDVDDVRKKAFGTLEDDIEKSIVNTPKRKLEPSKPKHEEKSIDDLLEETSFDTIPVKENKSKFHIEEPVELEILDKKEEKQEKERIEAGETLENDLFDLIDSMYEDKGEEE